MTLKILIFDDQKIVQRAMARLLSQKKHKVKFVESDGEFNATLQENQDFDVVVVNYTFSETESLLALYMLRNYFDLKHIPVIVLTLNSELRREIEALECIYINAPGYSCEELCVRIERVAETKAK